MRFAIRLAIYVPATPAAPIGTAETVQAVIDQVQPRRRVALHDEQEPWIKVAQRSLRTDVRFEPFVCHFRGVRTHAVAVIAIPADAGPGRVIVFATIWR